VVILTAYHYEQYVRALFAVGVHGYLLKSTSGDG
jgi:DNA-binding NarL/FixJ family response regulator